MIQAYSVEQIRAVEAAALAKDGDGTLLLTGNNTYAGVTIVTRFAIPIPRYRPTSASPASA